MEQSITKRSYRILALATVIGMLGMIFWFGSGREIDRQVPEVRSRATQSQPLFASYPAPKTFPHFTYGTAGLTEQNILEVKGTCSDDFFAILVFPGDADYRADPSLAVMNKAFPCPADKKIAYTVKFQDLPKLQSGSYYLMVADQPIRGVWYNPR
jgi:hypothetical protein